MVPLKPAVKSVEVVSQSFVGFSRRGRALSVVGDILQASQHQRWVVGREVVPQLFRLQQGRKFGLSFGPPQNLAITGIATILALWNQLCLYFKNREKKTSDKKNANVK